MSFGYRSVTAAERTALAKQCYDMHIAGWTDYDIAEKLVVDVFQVTSWREYWAEHRVEIEPDDSIARSEWRERIRTWLERLDTAYSAGQLEIDKAVGAFDKLAKVGIQLDGLAKAGKLGPQAASKVDKAIEELLGAFPANAEEDLPL